MPRGHWDDVSNQLAFMNDLAKKLSITDTEGWFGITWATLRENEGSGLLKKYNNSLPKLLGTVYPYYQQICRDFILGIVSDLKLSKVQDAVNVPSEYLSIIFIPYINRYVRQREPLLLRQHDNSVAKCTSLIEIF